MILAWASPFKEDILKYKSSNFDSFIIFLNYQV